MGVWSLRHDCIIHTQIWYSSKLQRVKRCFHFDFRPAKASMDSKLSVCYPHYQTDNRGPGISSITFTNYEIPLLFYTCHLYLLEKQVTETLWFEKFEFSRVFVNHLIYTRDVPSGSSSAFAGLIH